MKYLWIIFIFSLNISYANEKRVRLCLENLQLYPYSTGKEQTDKKEAGALVDIIIEAHKKKGIELEIIRRPWKRCLMDTRSGKVDATAAVLWSEERDKIYAFPKKANKPHPQNYLWSPEYVVITNKASNVRYKNGNLLNHKYGLSAPEGYLITSKLISKGISRGHEFGPSRGVSLVAINRIDGYVIERQIGRYFIAKEKLEDKLLINKDPFHVDKFYFVFSKSFQQEHSKLTEEIWDNIAMIRNQKGKNLIDYYFKKDVLSKYL